MAKIGVFDSGVGGQSVANAISAAMPEHQVLLREDKKNLPYGDKTPEQLMVFVLPVLQELVDEGCEIIVVACNTVTTNIIENLRKALPIPLIGMEPMVKPAAEATTSNIIAVCATPRTLSSARYHWLKDTYAKGITVLEPDCSDWSRMIEHNQIEEDTIAERITDVLDQGADVIVLGCTHYHWIEDFIKQVASGRAQVLQPEEPVIAQLQRVLGQQP